MKSVILNVRIPQEMSELLMDDCSKSQKSMSNNIREIISSHYEFLSKKEKNIIEGDRFYCSVEFIDLIFWIAEKVWDGCHYGCKSELEGYKKTLFTLLSTNFFPDELKHEFEKVIVDIQIALNDFDHLYEFKFSQLILDECFNYEMLREFIRNKVQNRKIYL